MLNYSDPAPPLSVCSLQPRRDRPSETFIRETVSRLPTHTTICRGPAALTGDWLRDWLARGRYAARRVSLQSREQCASAAYRDALNQLRPDVVLAQYGILGALATPACRELGAPLVACFRGFDATKTSTIERFLPAYRELFDYASALIAVSPSIRDSLIMLGAAEDRIVVNPSGADCDMFHGARPEQAPNHFVAVGRFVAKKAPLLTLEAFRLASTERPDLRLTMIGDGPLLEDARRAARGEELRGRVTFLGAVSHRRVAEVLRSARGFLQHSVIAPDGDSEGTPVAVMEAAASGLPVIATRHAGIPHVVTHNATGLLCEEHDTRGMADAILRLADDPALAALFGAAGARRVRERFSLKRSVRRLYSVLRYSADGEARPRNWSVRGDLPCAA